MTKILMLVFAALLVDATWRGKDRFHAMIATLLLLVVV